MILIDLTQKIVDEVYGLYATAAGIAKRQPPAITDVRTALESDVRRFIVPAGTGDALKAELWYTQDPNKNLMFTFAFPTDLTKDQLAKAEAAKASFDQQLQQYLVDYYL